MIDRLHLENFKSHASTDIELGRFTVLVGPNGCGKSSVLQALKLYGAVASGEAEGLFVGADAPTVITRRGRERASLTAYHTDRGGRACLELEHTPDDPSPDETEWTGRFTYTDPDVASSDLASDDGSVAIEWWPGSASEDLDAPGDTFAGEEARSRLVRFDFEDLAAPCPVTEVTPRLSPTGRGLAAVLASLKLEDEQRFDWIVDALRAVVPSLGAVRFKRGSSKVVERYRERVGDEWKVVRDAREIVTEELRLDFLGSGEVVALAASEGTLIALGILTTLHCEDEPRLLLLDDLEKALHPIAQQRLVELIYDILGQHPDLQIVATTHSPYLVDAVKPEDVRVMTLRADGTTACQKLTDHPDADRALQVLTSGEFLSAEGEDWVAGEDADDDG